MAFVFGVLVGFLLGAASAFVWLAAYGRTMAKKPDDIVWSKHGPGELWALTEAGYKRYRKVAEDAPPSSLN